MRNNRWFILSIVAALFVTTYNSSCSRRDKSVYKIGCITPLTGSGAEYGAMTKKGIDLAVKEINENSFLDKPLEVVYADDAFDPKSGVAAFSKLVTVDKVPAILGPFGSTVVMACAKPANENKVVLLTASATADQIAGAGEFVFRSTPPNSRQGGDIAQFCFSDLKTKRAVVIFQTNDYGVTLKDGFEQKFRELGGSIVFSEGAAGGTADFRSMLIQAKSKNPDVVFFPLHDRECGALLRQAGELGLKALFISADGAMTNDLLRVAGNAAEGSYYTSLPLGHGVNDSLVNRFLGSFEREYGETPNPYSAYYYEATMMLARVIKEGADEGTTIRNKLLQFDEGNPFIGVAGKTSFDDAGVVNRAFDLYVVRDGKFVSERRRLQ